MADLWQIIRAFSATRWHTRKGLSRAAFLSWQEREVERWLRQDVSQVRFYHGQSGPLSALPIIDKATVMQDFGAFNRGEISAQTGWAHFETDGRIGNLSVGASTGTSGNRALYVITPQERNRWLGTILAKALPRFPLQAERVAVILPQSSALYETAAQANRLKLGFFDLREGLESWLDRLRTFDPTCIVGPPRILRVLAECDAPLRPRILYAGAETLDPVDQDVIEARFGVRLGQIYMATEGLFGVTCPHGTLHLAEDTVKFEFETAGEGLVNPLISSFRRQYQIMARYRMNDLLRLSPQPCACGSPLQAVSEIVGRMDDMFVFEKSGAQPVHVTPDILRNAVLDADRGIDDFRIRRTGEHKVSLELPLHCSHEQLDRAHRALERTLRSRCPQINLSSSRHKLRPDPQRKLRRVENQWRADT